jgi:hypothetical protein
MSLCNYRIVLGGNLNFGFKPVEEPVLALLAQD